MDLPGIIPIFALPNVVLFPDLPLALHVFEPRYRQMVKDAAATHELIGITLLRGDWQKSYYERPDVFDVGCVGKMVKVEALPDGRYNILLQGICEFEIRRHVFQHPYREAEVQWWNRAPETILPEVRAQLIETLGRVVSLSPQAPAYRLLHDGSVPDQKLVNFFSYFLDLPALAKQGLLQQRVLAERALALVEAVEFRLAESQGASEAPDRRH